MCTPTAMPSWFSKTTVYYYPELISELLDQVHNAIDAGILHAHRKSRHPSDMFRFYASSSWMIDRNTYVEGIPYSAYTESIERLFGGTHQYCINMIGDPGYWYNVSFIHGRSAVTEMRPSPLNARMAKAAIALAKESNDRCPITLEPVTTLRSMAVAHCGHVCCEDALRLDTCPMCRVRCVWTLVCEM
jgi:hypothetical protein